MLVGALLCESTAISHVHVDDDLALKEVECEAGMQAPVEDQAGGDGLRPLGVRAPGLGDPPIGVPQILIRFVQGYLGALDVEALVAGAAVFAVLVGGLVACRQLGCFAEGFPDFFIKFAVWLAFPMTCG